MATAAVQSDPPLIVRGQLAIRTIPGRNGRFTVGRLTTRLGLFHVKDPELEQYPEGKYDGEFVIRYIYPKAYPVGDGMRFEIRANLDGMTLSGIDKLSKAEASDSPESDDAALFGILWPLEESVKLDSTIDRRTLRLQIARLNQLGYAFDATAQQWNLQLEPQAA